MTSDRIINSYKEVEELLNSSNLSFDNLKYLAKEVSANSWSPYSQFPVGAVAVGIDQNKNIKVFSGTNVEPTIPLSVCAERNAIFSGISAGYKKFIAIAVSCPKVFEKSQNNKIEINNLTPCGACREVILQKVDHKGIILLDGVDRIFTPKDLLPHPILDQNKLKNITIEEMDTLDFARNALHNAQVPYTKEKYGVAILLEVTKEIFSGTTVDSTSFGCSVEPLKAALGALVAKGNLKNKIKAIAFAFPFVKYPPGDALQIISDYCDPKTKIIIDNMGTTTIEELLPWAFKL